jgi:hypothetical protein
MSVKTDQIGKVASMFLDLRDQWPPVPPPPVPETAKPRLDKRGERIVGLIVAINLGLLLLAPIAVSTIAQGVAALIVALHR